MQNKIMVMLVTATDIPAIARIGVDARYSHMRAAPNSLRQAKAVIPVLQRADLLRAHMPNQLAAQKRFALSTQYYQSLIGAKIALESMSVLQSCIMSACSLRLLSAFCNRQGVEDMCTQQAPSAARHSGCSVISLHALRAVVHGQLSQAPLALALLDQVQLLLALRCILHLPRSAMACRQRTEMCIAISPLSLHNLSMLFCRAYILATRWLAANESLTQDFGDMHHTH